KSTRLRNKVSAALTYPLMMLAIGGLVVFVLMWKVVPQFKTIFEGMDTAMPAPTQLLIDMSYFIAEQYGWAVIIFSPFCVFFFFKLLKTSEGGRLFVDNLKLRIPIFGLIISKTAVARFTRTLGTLLTAGVPILEALNITRETAGNEVYSRAMIRVHDGIREGESFAEPLRKTRVVEAMVVNMIDVGEETGELDKMLIKVADNYDDEVDTLVSSMVSMLEPIMVITLGIIVGFIVVSLFMPLVSMIQGFSR
ncbi:MAG: type II secretion system F family protein, partial [Planctomycetaceae bacterium]